MEYEIYIQGLESSYWMKEFIAKKLTTLNRYLTPASHLSISLIRNENDFEVCIEVSHPVQGFVCSSHDQDLYMAFSNALEKMSMELSRAQKIRREKVQSVYFSLKNKIA